MSGHILRHSTGIKIIQIGLRDGFFTKWLDEPAQAPVELVPTAVLNGIIVRRQRRPRHASLVRRERSLSVAGTGDRKKS